MCDRFASCFSCPGIVLLACMIRKQPQVARVMSSVAVQEKMQFDVCGPSKKAERLHCPPGVKSKLQVDRVVLFEVNNLPWGSCFGHNGNVKDGVLTTSRNHAPVNTDPCGSSRCVSLHMTKRFTNCIVLLTCSVFFVRAVLLCVEQRKMHNRRVMASLNRASKGNMDSH